MCRSSSKRRQVESTSPQAQQHTRKTRSPPVTPMRSPSSRGLHSEIAAPDSSTRISRRITACRRSRLGSERVPLRHLDRTRCSIQKLQRMQTSNLPRMLSTSINAFKISCATRTMTKNRAIMLSDLQRMSFSVRLSTQAPAGLPPLT